MDLAYSNLIRCKRRKYKFSTVLYQYSDEYVFADMNLKGDRERLKRKEAAALMILNVNIMKVESILTIIFLLKLWSWRFDVSINILFWKNSILLVSKKCIKRVPEHSRLCKCFDIICKMIDIFLLKTNKKILSLLRAFLLIK